MRSSRGVIETEEWGEQEVMSRERGSWDVRARCAVGREGHTPAVTVTGECVRPVLSKSPCDSQRESGCLPLGKEMDWPE